MSTDPYVQPVPEEGYPGSAVLAAAIGTVFFPLVSLIAALLLLSQQANERKRGALRTWAWVSAGWIAVQILFFVILVATFVSTTVEIGPTLEP